MPNRRAFLLGGVALASATLLDGCGVGPDSLGLSHQGPTASGSFASAAARRTVRWTLTAPRGHDLDGLPVVITLHGRGGDHRTALHKLHLDRVVDAVVADGATPFALATVDGGDHSYYHRRSDGSDAGAMIRTELLDELAGHGVDRDRVALHGWSMGGYGALLLAGRERTPVRAVAVSSPALFAAASRTPPGAFDSAADYERDDVYHHPEWLTGVPVRIDCGKADPFYSTSRDFASRLRPAPAGGFEPGGHDAAYWRRVAPAQLRFLAGHLAV